MPVTFKVALPVLPTVKLAVPDEPTLTLPTETDVTDNEMTGAGG